MILIGTAVIAGTTATEETVVAIEDMTAIAGTKEGKTAEMTVEMIADTIVTVVMTVTTVVVDIKAASYGKSLVTLGLQLFYSF